MTSKYTILRIEIRESHDISRTHSSLFARFLYDLPGAYDTISNICCSTLLHARELPPIRASRWWHQANRLRIEALPSSRVGAPPTILSTYLAQSGKVKIVYWTILSPLVTTGAHRLSWSGFLADLVSATWEVSSISSSTFVQILIMSLMNSFSSPWLWFPLSVSQLIQESR